MTRGQYAAQNGARGNKLRVALIIVSLIGGSGCAQRAAKAASAQAQKNTALGAEIGSLRHQLAERERRLNQLENRLALLEAEQRQLRYEIAEHGTAPPGIRETVRIGGRGEEGEPAAALEEEHPRRREPRESRPVLRLYEDRRRESSEPLMPVPVVSERLPVAPLPMAGVPPIPAQPEAVDSNELYRRAIDLVRQRDFAQALTMLNDFLLRYPADARSSKVMFWRGEVLFAQREYARALQAFESCLAREPSGDKAADALLKIGMCHKRLGAPERARAAIERLKAQFPKSDAARMAAQEDA